MIGGRATLFFSNVGLLRLAFFSTHSPAVMSLNKAKSDTGQPKEKLREKQWISEERSHHQT